ncbi:MAG: bifunctional precorrin-2 dehydrogenase/sirohydrochlorin ferrochelatase [Chloroflexota bacterium]|nr:bifunctional precorrin-2 dehydrogenase/sirohydrochlorin ferrochelatase [Chloroflexota bacterium]
MQYYPVYLDLRGRPCVVVGGGRLAEEKVKGLLEAEADVTVVAPRLTNQLQRWAEAGHIRQVARPYVSGDLAGAFLAISTLNKPEVNEQFWEEVVERNILANVMDDLPHCNFIAASIVRRGDLAITISTSGKAPALAIRLRQWLERELGEEYARFLELAGSLRAPLAERFPPFEERKRRWYELVDSEVLDLLRRGEDEAARTRITEIMGVAPVEAEIASHGNWQDATRNTRHVTAGVTP